MRPEELALKATRFTVSATLKHGLDTVAGDRLRDASLKVVKQLVTPTVVDPLAKLAEKSATGLIANLIISTAGNALTNNTENTAQSNWCIGSLIGNAALTMRDAAVNYAVALPTAPLLEGAFFQATTLIAGSTLAGPVAMIATASTIAMLSDVVIEKVNNAIEQRKPARNTTDNDDGFVDIHDENDVAAIDIDECEWDIDSKTQAALKR